MSGRQMIVGRSHLVGGEHGPIDPDYAEMMGFSVGAEPAPEAHVHRRVEPVAYSRGHQMHVIEEKPNRPREFPIGFLSPQSTPVPANQSQNIESKPQVIFRGERLAVPNSIVLNFQIADIKVGKDSQLAAPGALPAECFSNISVGVRMQLVTAEPGITITLSAANTDPANPHAFSSVLYGTVVE